MIIGLRGGQGLGLSFIMSYLFFMYSVANAGYFLWPEFLTAADPSVVGSFSADPGAVLRYFHWLDSTLGKKSWTPEEAKQFYIMTLTIVFLGFIIAKYFGSYNKTNAFKNISAKLAYLVMMCGATAWHVKWVYYLLLEGHI